MEEQQPPPSEDRTTDGTTSSDADSQAKSKVKEAAAAVGRPYRGGGRLGESAGSSATNFSNFLTKVVSLGVIAYILANYRLPSLLDTFLSGEPFRAQLPESGRLRNGLLRLPLSQESAAGFKGESSGTSGGGQGSPAHTAALLLGCACPPSESVAGWCYLVLSSFLSVVSLGWLQAWGCTAFWGCSWMGPPPWPPQP